GAGGGPLRQGRREGLREGALFHAEGTEDQLVHQLGERFAGDVDQELLHDGVAAAGVAPLAPGGNVHADRVRIRRLIPVQDLDQGRDRTADLVAGKAVHGETGGVAQDAAEGDRLLLREVVLRHLPAGEGAVDVCVEREAAL